MAEIIGNTVFKVAKVDSTNNYASNLIKKKYAEGTAVFAREQLAGRGQLNNKWESQPNSNLLCSIVFYPDFLPVHYQFLLSEVISLSVCDLVSLYVDNVKIKWPNDIYVGDKKIAGILIENSVMGNVIESSVAGIGLNINQVQFKSDAPNPVSLYQLTGRDYNLDEIQIILMEAIDKWYLQLKKGLVERLHQRYTEMLYRFGIRTRYKDNAGTFEGTITGVNDTGQLKIKAGSGESRIYHFKEVVFL